MGGQPNYAHVGRPEECWSSWDWSSWGSYPSAAADWPATSSGAPQPASASGSASDEVRWGRGDAADWPATSSGAPQPASASGHAHWTPMDSFAAARAATEPQEEACDDEDQAPAGAIGMLGPLAFSEPPPPLTWNDEGEPTPDGDEEPWYVVEDLPFALFHRVDLTQEGESMPQKSSSPHPGVGVGGTENSRRRADDAFLAAIPPARHRVHGLLQMRKHCGGPRRH